MSLGKQVIFDGQKKDIADKQRGASGDLGYDQPGYIDFINTAIAAATDVPPIDPTPTGLYFWVTTGTGSLGNHAILYQNVGGNSFYTWSRPKPSHRHHEKHGHRN